MRTTDKPVRILTIKSNEGEREFLEMQSNGVVFWKTSDPTGEAALPVDASFISEKFTEAGRVFDISQMPAIFNGNPYSAWL